MTERKPPGVSWESWIEGQIREAMDRGDFDDLPGAGKPIPGLDEPYDELWWVKQKLRREKLSFLPPTLVLRKDAEDARSNAIHARSEAEARRIMADINDRIRDAIRRPSTGPPLNLMPFDVDVVVREWQAEQRARAERRAAAAAAQARVDDPPGRKSRWWSRRARRR